MGAMINCVIYHPGDEGFEDIKRQITPIERVHNYSQKSTYIDAERCNSDMSKKCRRENVDGGTEA